MNRHFTLRRACALTWIAIGVLAAPAAATIAPALKVEILGEPRPAAAGEIYQGSFRVTAIVAAELTNFELVSNAAWATLLLDAPAAVLLEDEEWIDIPFETLAIDPAASMLELRFDLAERGLHFQFELSPESFAQGATDQPLKSVPAELGKYELDPRPRPEPALPNDVELAPLPQASGELGKAARWITVQGRFIYVRPKDLAVIGADVVTVLVYHANTLLGSGTTDSNGNYVLPVYWNAIAKPNPDLRVAFRSENSRIKVTNGSNQVITWGTSTWLNYAGSILDVGTLKPADAIGQEFLNIHTVLTRAWRMVLLDGGINVVPVAARRVNTKDGGGWYDAATNTLNINGGGAWNEILHVHEYGHHYLDNHGAGSGSGYCNGVCDNSSSDCGHCTWCEEADIDAWNEGLPTWIGWTLVQKMPADYGVNALDQLAFEQLALCGEDNTLHDPTKNEGTFVAFLNDLTDSANESEPMLSHPWSDQTSLSLSTIWDVTQLDLPLTPLQFMDAYVNRNFPDRNDIWETAKNNGYELDLLPPDASSFMIANGHIVNVASKDGTIKFSWVTAFDDMSGIAGYSYLVSTGGPQMPNQIQNFGPINTFTTNQLAPGTYWINLRAKDRTGKWSAASSSIGPYIILPPDAPDLGPIVPAAWPYPLVPEPVQLIPGAVPVPGALFGEGDSYWNLSFVNHGTLATSTPIQCDLHVDGQMQTLTSYPASPALGIGETRSTRNLGPVAVNGGRHTFGYRLDAAEVMAESNEFDNGWAKQWIWTPTLLDWGSSEGLVAPPARTGGWSDLGVPADDYNFDARRVNAGFGFYGVAIHAHDDADDYDIELYLPATGAESGFDTMQGYSARLGGYLDAVLFFHPLLNAADHDVALINWSGQSNYILEPAVGNVLDFDSLADVTWPLLQMISLYTVIVPVDQLGQISAELRGFGQKATLLWFDKSFGSGGLGDATASATTNASGVARIDLDLSEPGAYFVVAYRDPRDGTGPASLTLEVGPTKPDAYTFAPFGWYAPVVPSPLPDGTPGSTQEPAALIGDVALTWVNVALGNASSAGAASLSSEVVLDGATLAPLNWGAQSGRSTSTWNNAWQGLISGGRHTLASRLDAGNAIDEQDESNNAFAEQWVWQPMLMSPNATQSRPTPPDRTGAWSDVGAFDALLYNCDGVRVELAPDGRTRSGMWMALAAMPGVASDADLQLHEAASGVHNGFDHVLAFSGWGLGESDFVLVNGNRTLPRAFDVGLLEAESSENVSLQSVESELLASNPNGNFGPFAMPAGELLDLHELWLSPGNYIVQLVPQSGAVDWGMTLHRTDAAYQSKSTRQSGAIAWLTAAGQSEWLSFDIQSGGYYCLSVWKSSHNDLGLAASYVLQFQSGVTESPQLPLARTWLSEASPNPFNPRTSFELELQESDGVSIDVYDAGGRHVRELLQATLPAGRHALRWDGIDQRGLRVASGVYYLRLATRSGILQERRLTLLK